MYYTLFFGLKVTLRGIVSPEGRVDRGFTVFSLGYSPIAKGI